MVTAWSSVLFAAVRAVNALFFLLTATYCLLTYSPFAYQQFIRPHLVQGLVPFVIWHHLGYWVVLGATALTMLRDLQAGRGRAIGWSYLAVSGVVGIALLISPILPQVENDGRGLALALVALIPPIWLAAFDHQRTSDLRPERPVSEAGVLRASLVAALVVWAGQTAAMPLRLQYTGEIVLTARGILLGAVTSAVVHLLVFTVFALVLITVLRICRGAGEYAVITTAAAVAVALVMKRFVFAAISFEGFWAWVLACEVGVMSALLWSGIARWQAAASKPTGPVSLSALDVWRTPLPGARSRAASLVALTALGIGAYLVLATVMAFDWDFVVQRLCVLALWALAFGYAYGVLRGEHGRLPASTLMTPPLAASVLFGVSAFAQPRLPGWMGDATFVPEFVLQGYVATDPSFRLIQDLLHVPSEDDARFFAFLRSHTNITQPVAPVEIDFSPRLERRAVARPDIFIFVVDSLRRDYLSPYNKAVRFTPSIDNFARDSVVFENAFTRYGGTGLSMPSMWTGGMVLHKQYIAPYHPMSTLAKLLDAGKYVKLLSPDHITVQMIRPEARFVELDRERPEMQYQACRTLEEMSRRLATIDRDGPVFGHTRSLDLHVAHVRRFPVPAGKSYPGFLAPVAAAVEQIDACLGVFLDDLKKQGRYDTSIIILTADHGDSLGERLTWGHAITLFPEVLKIPIIVRVPPAIRAHFEVDPSAVSFLTDLTPSLYELTGHPTADLGGLYGKPLFVASGGDGAPPPRNEVLVGSSYGAVYGVLRDNGRKLYIADGINGREYAYDLSAPAAVREGITPADRHMNRTFIREQLLELARTYGYEPSS